MLRTLISSFSSSSSSAASLFFAPSSSLPLRPLRVARASPPPSSGCPPCEQVKNSSLEEMEGKKVNEKSTMEALKPSLRPDTSQPCPHQSHGALSEEVCWVAERGNFLGEGFSVDDLLDLGEFAENEVEAEEETGRVTETEAGRHNEAELSSSPSSSSSALSFELPPPAPAPAPAQATLSDICLPAHDAEELEWVSYIIDDSISEFPPLQPPLCSGAPSLSPPPFDTKLEKRQGPSSGPTVCALSTEAMVPVKAKRSKRSRGATAAWSMSGPLPFADSTSSSSTTTSSASSCSSTSSSSPLLVYDPSTGSVEQTFLPDHLLLSKKPTPKKRGRKPKNLPSSATAPSGERRCSHCGVQKTPQWRAGPLGAKTLCNACGVRFKSGRLLPEYRPACSPTFVSHIHSNSHRKVLEMRRQKEAVLLPAAAALPVASF